LHKIILYLSGGDASMIDILKQNGAAVLAPINPVFFTKIFSFSQVVML